MTLHWQVGLTTDKGPVRERNEDFLLFRVKENRKGKQIAIAVVADGMGAYKVGDVASYIAIDAIQKWWEKRSGKLLKTENPIEIAKIELTELIYRVNKELIHNAKRDKVKLGTTISIILFFEGNYFICHIGDTRIYRLVGINSGFQNFFRKQQTIDMEDEEMLHQTISLEEEPVIFQLTTDHSWVQDQINKGLLSVEAAEHHPKKNVLLQCLGINQNINPYFHVGTYDPNDIFILCTDGFYSVFPEQQLIETIKALEQKYTNLQPVTDEMVKMAESLGTTDNITVLLIRNMYAPSENLYKRRGLKALFFK
ncbi:PP2C family protein-serine/threonine phosphatase [Bacillus kwashiorkori]|uniref:PP2C family protein-serine/threonine phosphatase n=1 Tax=Bacillus kwashiorkori TaxID=1522318 RepID=UPI0007833510|nr:protein phosphatase 2C domain-containing protein [Bacillus kwashiorkori]